MGTDSLPSFDHPSNPYASPDPTTPQRASQVFGFLISKRRPPIFDDQERSLPNLPSTFSISSNEGSLPAEAPLSHFSSDGSFESVYGSLITPAMPTSSLNDTLSFQTNSSDTRPARSARPLVETSSTAMSDLGVLHGNGQSIRETDIKSHAVKVIMTGPTKVIVTAPTPSTNYETPTRIPRGPRTQHGRSSSGGKVRRSATLAERSNSNVYPKDMFTPVMQRRKPHHRTSSRGSYSAKSYTEMEPSTVRPVEKSERSGRSTLAKFDKENGTNLFVDIPCTPLRSKSASSPRNSRPLFRAAVDPSVFRPPAGMTPSPASSSELSPVGRQLMVNLRQQRTKAREADRQKRRKRFSSTG